ncbi:unnamed protein product [Parnassius mnemosyne]|uniref:Myb-like domain-containing protein n=1 Tax=Parnassius mnemosyne TaxID=213953 RepID=A0AAV1KNJ2_9NEOP
MSTRRARIKAVTSLPPRRKNAEEVKHKQIQDKEHTETRPLAEKNQELHENISLSKSINEDLVQNEVFNDVNKTPKIITYEATTTLDDGSSIDDNERISKKLGHSVKIPNLTLKSNTSAFASPQVRDSPIRKVFASPLAPSPKLTKSADVSQHKSNTPQRHKSTPNAEIINENNEIQITDKNVNKITHKSVSPTINHVNEDYSEPSVPESLKDDTVMDGIVPLQPAASAPKPIDFLKNEIISENVEVLFDPIVPLPSPSKVRPKLRPTPRLGPNRRNSIQGSASESEDETRRAQISSGTATPSLARQRHDSHTSHSTLPSLHNRDISRIRNDSVCSSVSQATHPAATASPLKERHYNKSRRQDAANRRMAAMRRKRENVKRDTLTMYDLIFYNPTTNPIIPDQDEINAKEENAKEEERANKIKDDSKDEEEDVDDPPEAEAAPVPQIKLGPNGEIILDETSLVIKQTASERKVSSVVREGAWGAGGAGGGRYRRGPRSADWSAAETVRFYRALAALGTDFTLMAQLFPDRSRRELKLKFKKEEKLNGAQVDKALRSATTWDAEQLQEEFITERAETKRRAQLELERIACRKRAERERIRLARQMRVRNSRGAKALETRMVPGITQIKENEVTTADELLEHVIETRNIEKSKANKTPQHNQSAQTSSHLATLTFINKKQKTPKITTPTNTDNIAVPTPNMNNLPMNVALPNNVNSAPAVPPNIETGSLVVLTVNDPSSPSKKMLQTYIAHGGGRLTPVALPATLLNSVVGYMKKGTPKSTVSTGSSPHFASPNSVTSQDSRTSVTPSVLQVNPSPVKRQRLSSYTITQL